MFQADGLKTKKNNKGDNEMKEYKFCPYCGADYYNGSSIDHNGIMVSLTCGACEKKISNDGKINKEEFMSFFDSDEGYESLNSDNRERLFLYALDHRDDVESLIKDVISHYDIEMYDLVKFYMQGENFIEFFRRDDFGDQLGDNEFLEELFLNSLLGEGDITKELLEVLFINYGTSLEEVLRVDEEPTINISWSLSDVLKVASEIDVDVTRSQGVDILNNIKRSHDASMGTDWEYIQQQINYYFENK